MFRIKIITFVVLVLGLSLFSPGRVSAQTAMTDSAFIEMVQKAAYKFFWSEANGNNGLIRDRDQFGSGCSIASVGFGLSALCVAVDHGWLSRSAAADRVKTTLNTFWSGPQGADKEGMIGYKGFFYHFLDMYSARRLGESELSSIDTALLLAGILHAGEYFSEDTPVENSIRELADSIYRRVDWNWMRNYQPNITLGWTPEKGFIDAWWRGYNEAMIMTIMGLGSPTHPIPASAWTAWTGGYSWQTHYGYSYVNFPPLFGHQYSHCWIDFRNIQDKYMRNKGLTYFENSRRATLAQREYCIANPGGFKGYSENIWGLTACDGPAPKYYTARGAPPAENDDGTIAPTAAGGSIVFTPEQSIAALRYMYDTYKSKIWKSNYGFRDSFNLKYDWWATDVIGIDQGTILLMMENYSSGRIWQNFMKNEYIQNGLTKAGFETITALEPVETVVPEKFSVSQNYPNPFNSTTWLTIHIPQTALVSILVYDITGKLVGTIAETVLAAGEHHIPFRADGLAGGIYLYRVNYSGLTASGRIVLVK